jgi:hypothetical protein
MYDNKQVAKLVNIYLRYSCKNNVHCVIGQLTITQNTFHLQGHNVRRTD